MILILLSILASTTRAAQTARVWVERQAYEMGTVLDLRVAAPSRTRGLAASEQALRAVRRADDRLSTWRDDSEIARLNHAPAGRPVPLSDTLYNLLREAERWSRATAAAFDPGVGALVDLWDLRGRGRVPTGAQIRQRRPAVGLARFRFDDAHRTVARMHPDAWLDTGGFGKGVALREAGDALRAAGTRSALLNFGGQVLAIGQRDGRPWLVPVAHPSHRQRPVALLRVHDRSVATSSQSERPNHILDPRTGRPVPAWGSVTVVAGDPAVADILSTALFVMGPEAGLAWARRRADVGVLFLVEGKDGLRRQWNRAMSRYLVTDSTLGG